MELKVGKKKYLYCHKTKSVTTPTGKPVKNPTPILEAAQRRLEYVAHKGYDFHMTYPEFEEYLTTLTTEERGALFKELTNTHLSLGHWIRYSKPRAKEFQRALENLKRAERFIGMILQS